MRAFAISSQRRTEGKLRRWGNALSRGIITSAWTEMWVILISMVCLGMLHRSQCLRSGIAVAYHHKSVRISGSTVKNFAKMEWVAAHGIPPSRLFQTKGSIGITEENHQRATFNAFSGLGLFKNMVEGLSSRDLSDPTPVLSLIHI